jgi:hypothetical protein
MPYCEGERVSGSGEHGRLPVPLYLIKRFWVALTILTMVFGSFAYWIKNAFYDTGYAPVQPIAFYHKVHAGDLKIDCKYCHFNAERGKHPGVPPMSVCMGCHNHVVSDNPEYQKEIAKLKAIADSGSYELDGVVYEGGVVHWRRVHKLPDHVYFSHQWHVRAGVACQTCHGPVQEMTVMRQFSDLTMSWCVDCHRKSNYVAGREYREEDPATFVVGTASRDIVRQRQVADPVVAFASSHQTPHADAHAHAPSATAQAEITPSRLSTSGESAREDYLQAVIEERSVPPALREAMKAKWRNLPIWRLADLPETHRAFYKNPSGFQNAPTQCNTCHQ